MSRRVLHVVYDLIRGGSEGQCARVAMALGHRVAVTQRNGFFLEAVERACGPAFETGIRHMASLDTLRRVRRLAGFIRRERFDLVHCWDADAAIFGSAAARWAGVPCITSHRDLGQIYPARKLRLMTWADRSAAAVVVNAEAIRQGLVAGGFPEAKVRVVRNLVDLAAFDALASKPFPRRAELPSGRLIGMVARLDPEKDVGTLIRAMARLVSSYRDLFLVIAGDGPERPKLEALLRQQGVDARVVFLGDVNDVPSLLAHLEIGVLVPSANEGLSNSILEYMAAGLPVIATDCGGNRELVDDASTGFILPPGDDAALAAALMRLLDNSALAKEMGARGRRRVESDFAQSAVLARWVELYESVLHNRGRTS